MLKMSRQTGELIYVVIGVFTSVLMGSVLYSTLQRLNSSGLVIPSGVNVFQYVYPTHPLTPEEAEVIVVVFAIIVSAIMLVKFLFERQTTDEGWD